MKWNKASLSQLMQILRNEKCEISRELAQQEINRRLVQKG